MGRIAFNDQLVARMGQAISAPVGSPAIVEIPKALIDATPDISHYTAGPAHAVEFIPACSERIDAINADLRENRARFASLAILFGWAQTNDTQFIYSINDPKLVHSVDHGHFFPGGPNWSIASLAGAQPAEPYQGIIGSLVLTPDEIVTAASKLNDISPEQIAELVNGMPPEWGVPNDEQNAISEFVKNRRQTIIQNYPTP